MAYLLERDVPSGKEGSAFITRDGKNVEMFGFKKFESNAEFDKADFAVVGTRKTQSKVKGVKYTGSATIYYGTSVFLEMLIDYEKTGRMPYFTFQVTNDDPATTIGRQTIAFYNVSLDKVPLSLLDAEADTMSADITFTFSGFEALEKFHDPESYGSN